MIKANKGQVDIVGAIKDVIAEFACICMSIKENYDEKLLEDVSTVALKFDSKSESMECAEAVAKATREYADRRLHDEREEDDSLLSLLKKIVKRMEEDD